MWRHLLDLLRAARRPLVVFDFETSGLGGAPPVEAAVLVWAPWEEPSDDDLSRRTRAQVPEGLTYAWQTRLDPGRPIDVGSTRVHGIRDADVRGVRGVPAWNEVEVSGLFRAYALGDPLDGPPPGRLPAIWAGHNAAGSDVPWARTWRYLPSLADHEPRVATDNPVAIPDLDVVDTMRTVRRLQKEHPHPLAADIVERVGPGSTVLSVPCIRIGLDAYSSSLVGSHVALVGFRHDGEHGALGDCVATARVLARLLDLWSPLWVGPSQTASANKPAADVLRELVALLGRPPPGQLSWDGWLGEPESVSQQRLTLLHQAADPASRWVWRRGKYQGQRAHRDAWVLALPRHPTGDDARPAWCSAETAAVLEACR